MKAVDPQHITLIDALLVEQGQLSAVERFSSRHERHQIPAQQKFYRDLIPLTAPRQGEQFAFEVDLDSCSGCKACVTACHSLNGLDDHETWRAVGKMVGGSERKPYQQTITTACHHCIDPGCLGGCPVDAYEKDFSTGIVRHLDDQCIGCQYCLWMCPYEVPQYSKKRGIVRKCDMCYSRLAVNEAPACVQACPNGAIAIRIVSKSARAAAASANHFLPDSPNPTFTIPATLYTSKLPLPADLRASRPEPELQHAHFPLIATLVFTQMAVGIFLCMFFAPSIASEQSAVVGAVATSAGLLASVFHLGRPTQGWRAVLGWKHSWLSREVLAFGLFEGVALCTAGAALVPLPYGSALRLFSLAASLCGLIALFCSGMVYHATRRDFWHLRFTGVRFIGTAIVLGVATSWLLAIIQELPVARALAVSTMIATVVKLGCELSLSRQLDSEISTPLLRSAVLVFGRLRIITAIRLLLGLTGGIILPFISLVDVPGVIIPALALGLCLAGEFVERFLFFTAVSPQKMPGTH